MSVSLALRWLDFCSCRVCCLLLGVLVSCTGEVYASILQATGGVAEPRLALDPARYSTAEGACGQLFGMLLAAFCHSRAHRRRQWSDQGKPWLMSCVMFQKSPSPRVAFKAALVARLGAFSSSSSSSSSSNSTCASSRRERGAFRPAFEHTCMQQHRYQFMRLVGTACTQTFKPECCICPVDSLYLQGCSA